MSVRVKLLAAAAAILGVQLCASSVLAAPSPYVVLYKSNEIPANAGATIKAAGGTLARTLPEVGIAIAYSDSAGFAAAMRKNGVVADAGPSTAWKVPDLKVKAVADNGPTAADVYYNAGEVWGVNRVHAPEAWNAGHTGSHSTIVAIIDTGIAWNHPDLAGNVVYVDCYTSAGSFAEGACNPYPAYSFHGTHVAGTVAAQFGGGKVVGVAPNAGLAGYNVFEPIEDCGVCAYDSTRWAAMIDAAKRGFKVISMSLGGFVILGGGKGTNEMTAFLAAEKRVDNYVNKLGAVVIASAGNESVNVNGVIEHVPGDSPGILNTAATGIRPNPRYEPGVSYDVRAFYSNYGAAVDVSAPGGDCGEDNDCLGILPNWFEYLVLSSSVKPDTTCAATFNCPVGYTWAGGTSMATPHVSGVAALVMDANRRLTPNQVKAVIIRTAERIGNRQLFGQGVANAAAAVGAP